MRVTTGSKNGRWWWIRFRKRARFSRSLACWQRFSQLSSCDAGNYSNFRN